MRVSPVAASSATSRAASSIASGSTRLAPEAGELVRAGVHSGAVSR